MIPWEGKKPQGEQVKLSGAKFPGDKKIAHIIWLVQYHMNTSQVHTKSNLQLDLDDLLCLSAVYYKIYFCIIIIVLFIYLIH